MFDFKPTEDIISMSEFRNTLADCVERTSSTHRPIILTQNGRATSVFLSATEWEKVCQKLQDCKTYEGFLISEGQSQRGEVKSHDQVKRMVRGHAKRRTDAAKRKRMAV